VHKLLVGVMIAVIVLCGGGCGENATRIHQKARKAMMAGDQADAERLFNKVLALDPDNLEAHFYLGWIYKIQGRMDKAITEFRKAIAIQPNHGGAYNHLGDLYLAAGKHDDALEAYKKVIILSPDAAAGHYKLANAYRQMGRSVEAADAFFEAGLLAVVADNKDLAVSAYHNLRESGHAQLAIELQGVLSPWFDPANDVTAQMPASRSGH
jgi:tetratricopeptide (TPR) repeat protein